MGEAGNLKKQETFGGKESSSNHHIKSESRVKRESESRPSLLYKR